MEACGVQGQGGKGASQGAHRLCGAVYAREKEGDAHEEGLRGAEELEQLAVSCRWLGWRLVLLCLLLLHHLALLAVGILDRFFGVRLLWRLGLDLLLRRGHADVESRSATHTTDKESAAFWAIFISPVTDRGNKAGGRQTQPLRETRERVADEQENKTRGRGVTSHRPGRNFWVDSAPEGMSSAAVERPLRKRSTAVQPLDLLPYNVTLVVRGFFSFFIQCIMGQAAHRRRRVGTSSAGERRSRV